MLRRDCFILPHKAGSIDALKLLENNVFEAPKLGEVRVRVKAIGLNFADVFTGLGLYGPVSSGEVRGPFVPGLEFSGVVEEIGALPRPAFDASPAAVLARGGQVVDLSDEVWALAAESAKILRVGDRVLGCMRFGAYATQVNVPAHQVKRIPENWSFEDAAAFPCQTLTVFYALRRLGGMERGRGQSVLIHSMAGGCGLQAVSMCLALGVQVVGTVGSESKVAMLLERFPSLSRGQIVVRERHRFKAQLEVALRAIGSTGFNIVLDAVLGDFFQPGFDLMSPGGRYVVYGAADMTPTHASMNFLAWARLAWQWLRRPRVDPLELPGLNKSVMGFNLIHCFNDASLLLELLDELFALDIRSPHVGLVLDFKDAKTALRTFQTGSTTGKVVLRVSY